MEPDPATATLDVLADIQTPPSSPEVAAPDSPAAPANDHDLVRDFILAAYSDLVPELVQGETTADLMASVQEARAAYATVRNALVPDTSPTVPAGGGTPLPVNPDHLPPSEKIRRGLGAR